MAAAGAQSRAHTSPPPAARDRQVWAKGVGTSFEYLDDSKRWQPIVDQYVINKLGLLCSHNTTTMVTYSNLATGQRYSAKQDADGLISQTNISTGVVRQLRMVPHFFEFQEAPKDWRPVDAPEALMALTAVIASSLPKTYAFTSKTTGYRGSAEGTLIDERGLVEQRNLSTQKRRHIRPTPVGPDGAPHFEYLGDDTMWHEVDPCCTRQLAAVAAGRGDAYYNITHAAGKSKGETLKYKACLDETGFVRQCNTQTGKERKMRPAPWLGHGRVALAEEERTGPRIRVDPTDGFFRGRSTGERPSGENVQAQEVQVALPIAQPTMQATPMAPTATATFTMMQMPAHSFHVPEAVPMGSAAAPVSLQDVGPLPVAQPVYYYQPTVMEPGATALPWVQTI